MDIKYIITLAFIFFVLVIPLKLMGPKKKIREDIYGNTGWRTVKTKKLRKRRKP